MGACTEPGNLLIVTELMPKGSVYDLLHNPKGNLIHHNQSTAYRLRILMVPFIYNIYMTFDTVQLTFSQKMKIAKDAAMGMNWYVQTYDTNLFGHSNISTISSLFASFLSDYLYLYLPRSL